MNLKEFQEKSVRTMNSELAFNELVTNMCMGMCGEVGEVVDLLKKHIFHGHELSEEELTIELGDILFYMTNLMTLYGIDIEDVAEKNYNKLLKRYPEGFDKEKSINRKV